MPFIKNLKLDNLIIGFWKINENNNELKKICEDLKVDVPKRKSSQKKREWICTRALLKKISNDCEIKYHENGAPYIKNGNISISHTKEMVAIILSQKNCSIDIEKKDIKAKLTINKFSILRDLNEFESTIVWCVKECIYKFYKTKKINFKEDILFDIQKFRENKKLIAKFQQQIHRLNFFELKNHIVVYL